MFLWSLESCPECGADKPLHKRLAISFGAVAWVLLGLVIWWFGL